MVSESSPSFIDGFKIFFASLIKPIIILKTDVKTICTPTAFHGVVVRIDPDVRPAKRNQYTRSLKVLASPAGEFNIEHLLRKYVLGIAFILKVFGNLNALLVKLVIGVFT